MGRFSVDSKRAKNLGKLQASFTSRHQRMIATRTSFQSGRVEPVSVAVSAGHHLGGHGDCALIQDDLSCKWVLAIRESASLKKGLRRFRSGCR